MHLDLKDPVTRLTCFALDLFEEIRSAPWEIDAQECRAVFRELLRAFDQTGPRQETFRLAKYALTAWLDDCLGRMNWPHAADWNAHPLEEEFFRTNCRHWRFFEQAELALHRQDWDALLVFQFCVEFGFLGIYANRRMKVRLNDPLPMTRASRDSQKPAPILSKVLGEDTEGYASANGGDFLARNNAAKGVTSQHPAVPQESALPATLAAWSERTFGGRGGHSPQTLPQRILFGRGLDASRKLLTEWAIVMAVGLLLIAVIFAIGH